MKKPDFPWKWHTNQDILVLSDFARYLVFLNHQMNENDVGFQDAYLKYFKPLHADYKSGKLTNLRHGNNLATYVTELERYLPEESNKVKQDEITKALTLYDKFKTYLTTYDDDLISSDDLINGLRKFL